MIKLTLRLPDHVAEALRIRAEAEHRSLNGQIIAELERALRLQQKEVNGMDGRQQRWRVHDTPVILEGAEAEEFCKRLLTGHWPVVVEYTPPDGSFTVQVRWVPTDQEDGADPHLVFRTDFAPDGTVKRFRAGIGQNVIDATQCGLSARAAMRLAGEWGLPG